MIRKVDLSQPLIVAVVVLLVVMVGAAVKLTAPLPRSKVFAPA